jgi:uncharacterized membrane protein (UPF0182 family)
VVMEPTLDQAVQTVFGTAQPAATPTAAQPPVESDLLIRARKDLNQAQEALREGKWEDFGKAMDALKQTLTPKQ